MANKLKLVLELKEDNTCDAFQCAYRLTVKLLNKLHYKNMDVKHSLEYDSGC